MLVRERMTHHPITIYPDLPIAEALNRMRQEKVRRFPVVDRQTKKLIGIVTEKELLYASPSPATSLSIHEINYLLSKITVAKVMTGDVITITEDDPIEDAARLMVDRGIGALPVMRGDVLVGIITETDLFKTFIELFAARDEGVRLTMLVPDVKGELYEIAQAIVEIGGNILSLGTFQGEDPTNRLLTVKVDQVPQEALVVKMREIGAEIVDFPQRADRHTTTILAVLSGGVPRRRPLARHAVPARRRRARRGPGPGAQARPDPRGRQRARSAVPGHRSADAQPSCRHAADPDAPHALAGRATADGAPLASRAASLGAARPAQRVARERERPVAHRGRRARDMPC